LVSDGDGVIVALPTAISPAVRLHIVETVIRHDHVKSFEHRLFGHQIAEMFHGGIRGLKARPVGAAGLPQLPPNTHTLHQKVVEFDQGKFAHLLSSA